MTILAILGWVLTAVVAVMLGKGAVEKIIGALMGGAKTYMPILVGVLSLLSYVLRSL